MNSPERFALINRQDRAFITGTVEKLNDQWVFFDDENDEATMLEFFDDYQLEVMDHNKWRVAEILSNHELAVEGVSLPLFDGMELRFKKKLTLSLGTLLEDISDEAFLHFLTTLNSLNYSIFDCIYCHNHLTFLEGRKIKQGVNFIIFDNGDEICNVQHHFSYYQRHRDRFEFTNSTGKRIIIEKIE